RRRRDAGRSLLRHGRDLGNEERVLRREPESRRGRGPAGRERRAGGRLQRLPVGGAAAEAEDRTAFVPPGADPERCLRGRAPPVAANRQSQTGRSARSETHLMQPLTPNDLWPLPVYEGVRDNFRKEVIAAKKDRRVQVGPEMTFVFENRTTVKFQVQEILRTERISDP